MKSQVFFRYLHGFSKKSLTLAAFIVMQRDNPFTLPAGPFTPLGNEKCCKTLFSRHKAVFNQTLIVSVPISFIHLFYLFTGKIIAGKTVFYPFLPDAILNPAGPASLGGAVFVRKAPPAGFF